MNASHERPAAARARAGCRLRSAHAGRLGSAAASLLGLGHRPRDDRHRRRARASTTSGRWGRTTGTRWSPTGTSSTSRSDSYGQFPFWNPYGCGGHPSWAGIESGTTIVSPWLPFYLFAPLAIALKVEIAGTALISAIGTWLLAGRFTRSAALRAFCCAVFVVNGRWALQAAAGHTWHLYYAWTPWTLYFFDRAAGCGERSAGAGPAVRWRDVVLCGACIAMMVYTGAIYPLPQTVLALGLWSILAGGRPTGRCARSSSALASGVVGFGLSAPKLLPVLDVVRRFPRLVDSTETLDLHALRRDLHLARSGLRLASGARQPVRLARVGHLHRVGGVPRAHRSGPSSRAAAARRRSRRWAWSSSSSASARSTSTRRGRCCTWRPSSSRSTSRRAGCTRRTLVLAVVFAGVIERGMRRLRGLRAIGELVLLACAAWVSWDIAHVARLPMAQMFGSHMPTIAGAHRGVSHRGARDRASTSTTASRTGRRRCPSEMATSARSSA